MTAKTNAKARGANTEKRFAEATGGQLFPGYEGDVDAAGHRVEVKYRDDLAGYGELRAHLEQAIANGKAAGKSWALAITGGRAFHNAAFFVVIPLDAWLEKPDGVSPHLDLAAQIAALSQQLLERMGSAGKSRRGSRRGAGVSDDGVDAGDGGGDRHQVPGLAPGGAEGIHQDPRQPTGRGRRSRLPVDAGQQATPAGDAVVAPRRLRNRSRRRAGADGQADQ